MLKIVRNKYLQVLVILLAIIALAAIPINEEQMPGDNIPKMYIGDTLKCNILLDKSLKAKGFTIGYLYELFNLFDDEQGVCIELTPEHLDSTQWNYLSNGTIDMVIINQTDTVPELLEDSLISSAPIDNNGIICVTKKENYKFIQTFNYWISHFVHTQKYQAFISKYSKWNKKLTNPYYSNQHRSNSISPYDNLIKRYTPPTWDWRLVASLIYQESKFKAGVSSSRGAIGLMQIKEATGRLYGIENIYDPEENIKAGTSYLNTLHKKYIKKGADSLNSIYLTLAAYNCGDGRVADCMAIAKKENKNPLVWNDLKDVIPLLSIEENYTLPMIKFGKFNGKETIRFVDEILNRFEVYKERIN